MHSCYDVTVQLLSFYYIGLMQNSVITMYHVAAICGLAVCSIDACLLCINRAMPTSLFNVHYVSRHFKRGVIYRRYLNVAMIGMTPIDYLVITSSVLNRFSKFRRHMKGHVTRYRFRSYDTRQRESLRS